MSLTDTITFVVAVNDRKILEQNLLASACLQGAHQHEVLVQENYPSAALAYNAGLRRAKNELVVFIHQDVFLPERWLTQLKYAVDHLNRKNSRWGVLGCWGARADGTKCGHVYSSGLGILGAALEQPAPVQTLDEIVLILRKSSGLVFNESLSGFHFYGTDICMSALTQGLHAYVISAFCVHNTKQILRLPSDFYHCYAQIKLLWGERLPLHTTCIQVSRFNSEVYKRRMHDWLCSITQRKRHPALRVSDPRQILSQLELAKAY